MTTSTADSDSFKATLQRYVDKNKLIKQQDFFDKVGSLDNKLKVSEEFKKLSYKVMESQLRTSEFETLASTIITKLLRPLINNVFKVSGCLLGCTKLTMMYYALFLAALIKENLRELVVISFIC